MPSFFCKGLWTLLTKGRYNMVNEMKTKLCAVRTEMMDFAASNPFVRAGQRALVGTVFLALTPMNVFAEMPTINASDMMDNLVAVVCDVFRMIGVLLLVWSVGQLVLAFRNEDADSKSRAMMVIVCSILLISVGAIYQALTGSSVDQTKGFINGL